MYATSVIAVSIIRSLGGFWFWAPPRAELGMIPIEYANGPTEDLHITLDGSAVRALRALPPEYSRELLHAAALKAGSGCNV